MMKKYKSLILIILFSLFLIYAICSLIDPLEAAAVAADTIDSGIDLLLAAEHVPDEIIVKFRDGISSNELLTAHSRSGSVVKKEFKDFKGLQLVRVPRNISMRQALKAYLYDPRVEYAEPNYIVHAVVTPNDTYFNSLWGLHNTGQTGGTVDADIDAPEAWDISTGSNDVVIAVVDTGVAYNHPDLSGNIWTNTGETSCTDGIDNDGNGYVDDCRGWDFIGDDNDPTDYYSHGTHVSGTIAAVGNNGLGITGVMWKAKIMPLRFLGVSGSGTTADAVSAILYANSKGAHVINNSWGGGGYSQALKDAIDASSAVVVCAAGNSGSNNDAVPFYPASYTSANIISVAASDQNDMLAYFSNYGALSVDVAAPGTSIYSSIPQFNYGTPVTVYSQDFNGASGDLPLMGWSRGGAYSTWAVTTGTGTGGSNSLEDSPGMDYRSYTSSWAGYMTPIPSVKDNLYTLSFKWKGVVETNYDYLDINYSLDAINWYWVDYRTGNTGGSFITDSTNEITFAADITNNFYFYFGFGLFSNQTNNYDGVYIDDVVLTRRPISIASYGYAYYQGTSMAAPHVSGIAGLIKAYNPGLTNLEIKDVILNTVDARSFLSGKVLTGGRVNAFNALNSLSCPHQPVRISRAVPAYYTTLQAAYNAAAGGETIQSQAVAFTDDLAANMNKSVILEGGYNCDYSTVIGETTLNSSIAATDGMLTIEGFVLQ
jgi:subtilisin family serine protease